MELVYPNKKQIMEFFRARSGFMKVHRIAELLVTPIRPNLQNEEIEHIKGFLHHLKAEGFLLIENEGQDIYHEGFSSTPDRVAKYFAQFEVQDYSDLTKRTDEELREIVRRNDNSNVPGSLYNRASQELELRHRDRVESFMRSQAETPARGKTVKSRYKNENIFIESRSQGHDEHLLIGKRDGSGDKAHVIVDKENGSLRLEDGRSEPTDIVPHIETTVTLPGGKKIVSTRGAMEVRSDLPKIEIEKVGFSKIVTTREGLAESFTLMIPVIIKNLSSRKILVRDIRLSLELPEGYQSHIFHDGINAPDGRYINAEEFLPGKFGFATNIKGREKGVNEQNAEYMTNKDKILAALGTAKIVFRISVEIVTLGDKISIEEAADLTAELLPQIKIGK